MFRFKSITLRTVVNYLNLIDYQNRILEKVKKLKYLKDQFLLEEHTSIRSGIPSLSLSAL